MLAGEVMAMSMIVLAVLIRALAPFLTFRRKRGKGQGGRSIVAGLPALGIVLAGEIEELEQGFGLLRAR